MHNKSSIQQVRLYQTQIFFIFNPKLIIFILHNLFHVLASGNPLTLTISNKAPDNRFFFCAEVEITNNNEVSYHPQVNSEGQL